MHNLLSFLRLIRFKNLLIIVLTQYLIKIFLINWYINKSGLSNSDFMIYLAALITIVAGGYIINDVYDIKIDKVNKPETRIIEKEISKEFAIKIYYILNLIGVISGFYTAYQINKLSLGLIFLFFWFSLWRYSKTYKTSFLIGNLQVAFLTALSIFNLVLFDLIPIGITNENSTKPIFYIILVYSGFSFIITLIREIIKDLEDLSGDKTVNANTMAINYGIKKTKKITVSLILIPIIGIAYFQYLQWAEGGIPFGYLSLLQILFIVLLIKTSISKIKPDFYFLSILCKIIMLMGILSIPLFTLTYLN